MKLKDLLSRCNIVKAYGSVDIDIKNIKINSNEVQEGDVFICLEGSRSDGHKFANEAVVNGAKAVICSQNYVNPMVTVIKVDDTRKAYSLMASSYYKNPADKLKIICVVGTNGKSTTAYIIKELLQRNGINCGLIGTIYYEYGDIRRPAVLTTPDPLMLHELFADMLNKGMQYVVMELSAHAIYLQKLYGVKSWLSIFTNLSQDHLDFFGNMRDYAKCKKSYFDIKNTQKAIINIDDNLGREIISENILPAISYGLENPSDVFAVDIVTTKNGESFVVNILDDILEINTMFFGQFNIYNILASLAVAKVVGLSNEQIMNTIDKIPSPDGRFNVIYADGIRYVVDFAHTPDGLFNLLREAKRITNNRVITIFGCGGDRDVSKRPIMGKIASEMSDILIVTSDNPRTESRQSIADDILQGVTQNCETIVELDRAQAIKKGIELAQKGDMVIIAGKGSENYIDENNIKTPYSDMAEVRRWIG